MLEMLFALSVLAFISLAALYLYNQAVVRGRTARAAAQVQIVANVVREIWAGQTDYGAAPGTDIVDVSTIVKASGRLTRDMTYGGSMVHAFGLGIAVQAHGAGSSAYGLTVAVPTYSVHFTNVPMTVCTSLVTANGGSGTSLVGIRSGMNAVMQAPPMTPETAQASGGPCPRGATGLATLIWRFT